MKKILVFNLKMNFNYKDVKNYIASLTGKINDSSIIFLPPTIFLPYFISTEYSLGSQNISEYDNGAHTGETSCSQLKSIGGSYVLIGHSERRSLQHEEDDVINLKIKKALENDLKVIFCVGETKEEREMLKTSKVLKKQIVNGLNGINQNDLRNVIIAYEPVWSISTSGTGIVPTNKEINDTTNFIIDLAVNAFNYKPKVLYGGSVNEKNINELNKIDVLSGFLVGGASLDINKVLKIKEVVEK